MNNSTNKYTLRPTDLGSSKDDLVIRFNGRDVGRTYADGTPVGPRWYWGIFGINLRGPLPEGVVVQGLADVSLRLRRLSKRVLKSSSPPVR